jgi:FKBP-type peptidyl-prolyl cis-trans isomerase
MRVGGRRRLIAPSDLAYGSEGLGKAVPPYATLIFDVELVAVR